VCVYWTLYVHVCVGEWTLGGIVCDGEFSNGITASVLMYENMNVLNLLGNGHVEVICVLVN